MTYSVDEARWLAIVVISIGWIGAWCAPAIYRRIVITGRVFGLWK